MGEGDNPAQFPKEPGAQPVLVENIGGVFFRVSGTHFYICLGPRIVRQTQLATFKGKPTADYVATEPGELLFSSRLVLHIGPKKPRHRVRWVCLFSPASAAYGVPQLGSGFRWVREVKSWGGKRVDKRASVKQISRGPESGESAASASRRRLQGAGGGGGKGRVFGPLGLWAFGLEFLVLS